MKLFTHLGVVRQTSELVLLRIQVGYLNGADTPHHSTEQSTPFVVPRSNSVFISELGTGSTMLDFRR